MRITGVTEVLEGAQRVVVLRGVPVVFGRALGIFESIYVPREDSRGSEGAPGVLQRFR